MAVCLRMIHPQQCMVRLVGLKGAAELSIRLQWACLSTVCIGSNSTWLDSTHSTCRAHAFWLWRASRTAQLDSLDTTSSTGSTCQARLAQHVELDRRYLQLSYDHRNSYCL